jgi:hypothetical protein
LVWTDGIIFSTASFSVSAVFGASTKAGVCATDATGSFGNSMDEKDF